MKFIYFLAASILIFVSCEKEDTTDQNNNNNNDTKSNNSKNENAKADKYDDYDTLRRALGFDARAAAADRMKTDEEKAKEEKEAQKA